MTITEQSPSPQVIPQYNLTPEERVGVFTDSVDQLSGHLSADKTNVLVVETDHPLANYVRSIEAEKLPVVSALIGADDESSKFVLVLQDKEEGSVYQSPGHVFRINIVTDESTPSNQLTGLPTFDDVIQLGLVNADELVAYYDSLSLSDLGRKYINVESNIAIDGVKASIRKPYSALGYRAIFELVRDSNLRGIVAYQNAVAMNSMAHLGLRHHPLMGNPNLSVDYSDMHLGTDEEDQRYFPLTIESIPWSKLEDGSAENNFNTFTNPEYADSISRIAGMVARKSLNIVRIV